MTIEARVAHEKVENLNAENIAKLIGEIDSQIDQAIYAGNYTVTTKVLTKKMREHIGQHYSSYGYVIADYNNNMLGISW